MKALLNFLLSLKVDVILTGISAFLITYFIMTVFDCNSTIKEVEKVVYKDKIVNTTDTIIIYKNKVYKGTGKVKDNLSMNLQNGIYAETFPLADNDSLVIRIKTFPAVDSLAIDYFLDIEHKETLIIDTVYVPEYIEKIKEIEFEPNILQKPVYTITAGVILGVVIYKYLIGDK